MCSPCEEGEVGTVAVAWKERKSRSETEAGRVEVRRKKAF